MPKNSKKIKKDEKIKRMCDFPKKSMPSERLSQEFRAKLWGVFGMCYLKVNWTKTREKCIMRKQKI